MSDVIDTSVVRRLRFEAHQNGLKDALKKIQEIRAEVVQWELSAERRAWLAALGKAASAIEALRS